MSTKIGDQKTSMVSTIRLRLKYSILGRLAMLPYRARMVAREQWIRLTRGVRWLFTSREWTNFTYNYSAIGEKNAVFVASLLTGSSVDAMNGYMSELRQDSSLQDCYRQRRISSKLASVMDPELKFGRQILYYLIARALKPKLVVEAGTDKGLGAMAIGAALKKNAQEGSPGRLVTIDRQCDRGQLVDQDLASIVTFVHGDSIESLSQLGGEIDFFIHDTTSAEKHMADQFAVVAPKLSDSAVVVSTWFNEAFVDFCHKNELPGFMFAEEPQDHWYRGGRLGVASFRLCTKP